MTAPSNAIDRASDDNDLKEYHTCRATTAQPLLAQGRSLDYMDKLSCGLQPYAKSLNDKIDPPFKRIL